MSGDGESSREFRFVENAIQPNLLAAITENPAALNQIFNVAAGKRTTLNELFNLERNLLLDVDPWVREHRPSYREFREGDVQHSQAVISKAHKLPAGTPTHQIQPNKV